ncbi:MAG: uncharacterized protein QOJ32_2670 [Frankiaceae bacterium]|nr:uncharacterized protein [Frankiaceae bacterium]
MTSPAQPDLASVAAGLSAALHDVGVPVPTARTASFAAAVAVAQPARTTELYWLARVTLLSEHAHLAAFDHVFSQLFGHVDSESVDPAEFRGDRNQLSQHAVHEPSNSPSSGGRGWAPPALVAQHLEVQRNGSAPPASVDQSVTVLAVRSADEILRERDLADLTQEEVAELRRLMVALRAEPPMRPGRRSRAGRRGRRVDLRASLRAAVHTGGDPYRLVRRRRRPRPRRLVLLCDVSGSMEAYARPYLQLLSGAIAAGHAEAFVFATRLTRVTRALRAAPASSALPEAGRAAPDWGGGTRIGAAVRSFLDDHGRRGPARGAVVVVLSDGWDAGEPVLLGEQMARLARLAHRVVWVNPRVAAEGFQPLTGGLAAALPHVDRCLSGHSLSAMQDVLDVLRGEWFPTDRPSSPRGAAHRRRLTGGLREQTRRRLSARA